MTSNNVFTETKTIVKIIIHKICDKTLPNLECFGNDRQFNLRHNLIAKRLSLYIKKINKYHGNLS